MSAITESRIVKPEKSVHLTFMSIAFVGVASGQARTHGMVPVPTKLESSMTTFSACSV